MQHLAISNLSLLLSCKPLPDPSLLNQALPQAGDRRLSDCVIVLATMHAKEQAIAPILTRELGVEVVVPPDFNTDQFGTFTRDVNRPGDQLVTARAKAQQAMDLLGKTVGIASEGSFGPHPSFPWVAANRELVVLLDRQQGLELVGDVLVTETNYRHTQVRTMAEALEFANRVQFPDHGLVVMPTATTSDPEQIIKGIKTEAQLAAAIAQLLPHSPTGSVHVETDMRAMMNPTRMAAIAKATQDLVRKLRQSCPQCNYPGFDVVQRQPGLRCAQCNLPTPLIRVAIYGCQQCGHQQESPFPDGQTVADPVHCSYCNP